MLLGLWKTAARDKPSPPPKPHISYANNMKNQMMMFRSLQRPQKQHHLKREEAQHRKQRITIE